VNAIDDPIAAIEEAARRQRVEEIAEKAITKARVKLVLSRDAKGIFFGTLALRLRGKPDWELETAATDGRTLSYNPDWVCSLSPPEVLGVLTHEVMHLAMAHHCRMGNRDPDQWNVAGDLAINGPLREAGFTLPACGILAGEGPYAHLPAGCSAEEYYAKLGKKPGEEEGEGGDGDGEGEGKPGDQEGNEPGNQSKSGSDPGGCGGVMPPKPNDPAAAREGEAEMQVAVAQAAQAAKGKGELPGDLARLVEEILEHKVPWQDVLREFVSQAVVAHDDYSWSSPNRRYISTGLYLPSLRSEGLGEVVVAVDTSGSIDAEMLEAFAGELNGILEAAPVKVTTLYCDSRINGEPVEWYPADGAFTLESRGGGGTDHRPIWDWLHAEGVDPTCVVCLTDGQTTFGSDPGCPVLWALTGDVEVPFGRKVVIG